MPEALLEFDPVSEDAANFPLSVWNTASYGITAFNPDAANQSVQWASSVDTEGALPASVRDENRTISMTVECLSAAALLALQAKAAKIGRERGTLKYTLPNSEVVIFDLLTRESFKPEFDDKYFINTGAYCTVTLGFTALPYGRGTEVDLGDNVETTLPALVFTDTGIKGDVSALGRLVVDGDEASYFPSWLTFGVQSRYYSSASTAALFFEVETWTATGAAANAGAAGASGSLANKVMRHSDVGTAGASSFTSTLSHVGAFRVFARVHAPATNTGVVSVRMVWYPRSDSGGGWNENTWAPIADSLGAAVEGTWEIIDLGIVKPPLARVGTQEWKAQIEAKSTVATDDVDVDCLFFVPLDCSATIEGNAILPGRSIQIDHREALVQRTVGTSVWYNPAIFEGDYLTLPPAGAEGRTLRMIVIVSGVAGVKTPGESGSIRSSTIPDVSARLYYTPRYLVVPAP